MGDHRLDVKIHLVGMGGEVAKIDWWVNWWPDKPELLYGELVQKARKIGLDVDDKTYLMSDGDGPGSHQVAPVCAPPHETDVNALIGHLRVVERKRDFLRSALEGLVGESEKVGLEQMELAVRLSPAPDQDKAAALNAIHALISTLDEQPMPSTKKAANDIPLWLHEGASFLRCSKCGRKSWSETEVNAACKMPQPGGQVCDGIMQGQIQTKPTEQQA